MTDQQGVPIPPGVIFMTTYGVITAESSQSLVDTSRYLERMGLQNVDIRIVVNTLVDKARNDCVTQLLKSPAQWMMFFDADMSWKPEILEILFRTAFLDCTWADIIGGYCNLRGFPYLPTIDRGSGTWESVEPNIGPVEAMRTGTACVLIKRHVLEKMKPPWYGVRPVPSPLQVMYELDNYANQRFDGRNPLRDYPEWDLLEKCAENEANVKGEWSTVGEDSGFCDRARALGFRIVVQTNAICHHVDKKVITPDDHLKAVKELREAENLACGVLG